MFLIFWEMELFIPKIKKILYIFFKKKLFKSSKNQNLLYFSKESYF